MKGIDNSNPAPLSINNKPYEGLKPHFGSPSPVQAAGLLSINNKPYEGLKQTLTKGRFLLAPLSINNKPYEGLKHNSHNCPFSSESFQLTINPMRD